MESFLNSCGLGNAISKFSEHQIEVKMLVNLADEEIKELLPNVGDRHRLKDGIQFLKRTHNVDRQGRKRTTTDSDNLINESGQSSSYGDIESSVKRLKKNDEGKIKMIITIMTTDEVLTAELIQMAEGIMYLSEFTGMIKKYHCHSGFKWLDIDIGKINCPLNTICSSQIAPQFRDTHPVRWMLPNFKRHLDWHSLPKNQPKLHYSDDENGVDSVLEIVIQGSDDSSSLMKVKKVLHSFKLSEFMIHKCRPNVSYSHPTPTELLLNKTGNCFLMRNMRKFCGKSTSTASAKLTARTPRKIAEYELKREKTARISVILREMCEEIRNYKDEDGQNFVAKVNPPTKEMCPEFYEKVDKPIDMSTIESNVEHGQYKLPGRFDEDILRLFNNAIHFFGITSPEGTAARELQCFYTTKKESVYERLMIIIGDSQMVKTSLLDKQNEPLLSAESKEKIIQCICGMFSDEGTIIQCGKCLVWQHTECIGAQIGAESYLCERCDNRTFDKEVPLNEYNDDGHKYYSTLMRGDLQVHQTDTVYVLRDIPIIADPKSTSASHTYKTIEKFEYSECDIFRVERLWKDSEGNRFVFGHHYLRPHETFHKPNQKFYQNEVVRVPLYEKLPIDLIMGRCWVLDPATFCIGRPVDSEELHIYICEMRVDKAARIFTKISKQYPICKKSYAFNKFEQKLKISRDYSPHHIGTATLSKRQKKISEQ